MNIRRATIGDLKSVQELNSMLFKKEDKDFGQNFEEKWAFSEDGIKCISGWINNKNSLVLLAEKGNQAIGYLAGEIREVPAWRKQLKTAELAEVFILDNYRGQGIGGQFIEKFMDWCREKGIQKVKIEASAGNEAGIRFYKRYGFHDHEVLLEKEL